MTSQPPFDVFRSNINEVIHLMQIHSQVTGSKPGRRHHVQILNKSAVVLLVACWEAFVEDVVSGALAYLIEHVPSYAVSPQVVLDSVAGRVQGPKAWTLAGDGWKDVLLDHLKEYLIKTVKPFHSPRAEQVDELFLKTIGLPSLSSHWRWRKMSPELAVKSLNELIALRGEIAHRVQASHAVHKSTFEYYRTFILRLAVITNNRTQKHLGGILGHFPWVPISFGRVK